MITRDSWLFTLAILSAVIVYLSNAPNPVDWNYNDWLKAASFAVATISGKLATSPLKGDGR